jgi:hypothetical protein
MLGTIKIPFKQAKVQDWVAQITFRDLIYLDWTGSIFSESWPLTLKTFMQNQLHLTNPSSSSSSASSLLTARRSMLITNVNIHTGNNVWSQFLPKASFGELTQTIQVLTLRDWIPWLLSFPHERFDATGDEYASLLEDTLENLLWKDLKSDASRFVLEACREAGASFSPASNWTDPNLPRWEKWIAGGILACRLFKLGKIDPPSEQKPISFPVLLDPWHNSTLSYYGGGGIGAPMQIQMFQFLCFSQPILFAWEKDTAASVVNTSSAKIDRLFLHYPRVPEAIQILGAVSDQFESMRQLLEEVLKVSK